MLKVEIVSFAIKRTETSNSASGVQKNLPEKVTFCILSHEKELGKEVSGAEKSCLADRKNHMHKEMKWTWPGCI